MPLWQTVCLGWVRKRRRKPCLAGTWSWLRAGAGWELLECWWFTTSSSLVGGAGASGSSRCFLEHHLSSRSPQEAGAVPGISAAWWLLCTKRKHGAACLQSLRMLPGLPELMLLFRHSSFSSCSLSSHQGFPCICPFMTCLSPAPGLSPSRIPACSSLLSPLGPLPKAAEVGKSTGQWVQGHFDSPQEKERQKLETLRKKQEAEQLRRQKLEEEKKRRLEETKL